MRLVGLPLRVFWQSWKSLGHVEAPNSVSRESRKDDNSTLSHIFDDEPLPDSSEEYDSRLFSICNDEFRRLDEVYHTIQAEKSSDRITPARFADLDHRTEMTDPQLQNTYQPDLAATELGHEDGRANLAAEAEHGDFHTAKSHVKRTSCYR